MRDEKKNSYVAKREELFCAHLSIPKLVPINVRLTKKRKKENNSKI